MKERFISSSVLSDYYTCKRKFKYRYSDYIVPVVTNEALNFGILLHSAMYKLYIEKDLDVAMDYLREQVDSIDKSFYSPQQMTELDGMEYMIEILMKAYISKHKDEIDNCTVIESEQRHRKKIAHHRANIMYFEYTPDLIIKHEGKMKIIDFKTTSRIDAVYLDKMDFAYQTLFYPLFISEVYNHVPDSFDYRILKKPSIRQTKKETLAMYRERLRDYIYDQIDDFIIDKSVPVNKDFLVKAKKDFRSIKKDISNGIKSRCYPKNPSACSMYGRCQYFDLCHKGYESSGHMFKENIDGYGREGDIEIDKKIFR